MTWRIAASLVAVLLTLVIWIGWRNGDERRILRQFDRLMALAEKKNDEGLLEAARRAQSLAAACIDEPEFWIPPFANGIQPRQEIPALLLRARAGVDALTIRSRDRTLEWKPDRNGATLRFAAEIRIRSGDETERIFRQGRIEWIRSPEGWRIAAVAAEDTILHLPER